MIVGSEKKYQTEKSESRGVRDTRRELARNLPAFGEPGLLSLVQPLQVLADADGGGVYVGRKQFVPGNPTDIGVVESQNANPQFEDGDDEILIVNAEEIALPTHWIKNGEKVWGRWIGYDEEKGREVWFVNGGYYRIASPAELSTGQVNEYASTPDTHHWVRDEETSGVKHGDTPVKIMTAITAVELGLNGTSGTGRKLYVAVASRGVAFDAGGRCFDIDPEATELFELDIPDTPPGITITNGSTITDVTEIVVDEGLDVTDNGGGSVTIGPAATVGDGAGYRKFGPIKALVTSSTGTLTLDAGDWRGVTLLGSMIVRFITTATDDTPNNNARENSAGVSQTAFHGPTYTTGTQGWGSGLDVDVYIDYTDGGKLKLDVNAVPVAATPNPIWRWTIEVWFGGKWSDLTADNTTVP